jgi:hypothetical protein
VGEMTLNDFCRFLLELLFFAALILVLFGGLAAIAPESLR